jgi:hypothetical protein
MLTNHCSATSGKRLMELKQFCTRLQTALSPAVYRGGAIPDAAPFALLVKHMNWLALGRYALGVLPWQGVEEKSQFLRTARKGVSKHLFTVPYLWQVGLYLVVVGPHRDWSSLAGQMTADTTGFHSVIIQAVHFIDLDSGKNLVNRSQWGPIRFGGTVSVTDVVNSVAERGAAADGGRDPGSS